MDSQRRRNAEADLRATAEDITADAHRVASIEQLKAELDLADPAMAELARESEQLTEAMATKARMESALRRQAAEDPKN
jgi:hypothetical protein